MLIGKSTRAWRKKFSFAALIHLGSNFFETKLRGVFGKGRIFYLFFNRSKVTLGLLKIWRRHLTQVMVSPISLVLWETYKQKLYQNSQVALPCLEAITVDNGWPTWKMIHWNMIHWNMIQSWCFQEYNVCMRFLPKHKLPLCLTDKLCWFHPGHISQTKNRFHWHQSQKCVENYLCHCNISPVFLAFTFSEVKKLELILKGHSKKSHLECTCASKNPPPSS